MKGGGSMKTEGGWKRFEAQVRRSYDLLWETEDTWMGIWPEGIPGTRQTTRVFQHLCGAIPRLKVALRAYARKHPDIKAKAQALLEEMA